MKNPIVFFDLETTGINQKNDRIVEMYMYKENPDGTTEEFYSRFNPYPVPVSTEAESVHGISSVDLQNEPNFSEKTKEVIQFIQGCDLGGYNIIHFDIPMLYEEIYRATGETYNFKDHRIFDSYKIWIKSETRTLTGAVKRYLNRDHEHAHSAKADVLATAEILKKQLSEYNSLYESSESMAEETAELNDKLDFSGKFGKNKEGKIVITFGKHKDKSVQQVYTEDSGYLKWIYEIADFPTDTKLIAKKIYEKLQAIRPTT
jgi:DNA polymerase-3 subunit epsilon